VRDGLQPRHDGARLALEPRAPREPLLPPPAPVTSASVGGFLCEPSMGSMNAVPGQTPTRKQ